MLNKAFLALPEIGWQRLGLQQGLSAWDVPVLCILF